MKCSLSHCYLCLQASRHIPEQEPGNALFPPHHSAKETCGVPSQPHLPGYIWHQPHWVLQHKDNTSELFLLLNCSNN